MARSKGETPARVVERFGELSDAGAQHIIVSIGNAIDPDALNLVGSDVIPALHRL